LKTSLDTGHDTHFYIMVQRVGHCCCPGAGWTRTTGPGTGWGGPGGGMTPGGWLAPAAARAARPAAASAASASLWKKTKNLLTITVHWNYLCTYVPVLLMWWDIMKKTFELHRVLRIPDFYPSRIPDPRSLIQKQKQKREVKKISCHTFLSSHKFQKSVIILVFKCWRKKIWSNFQRIIELFTKKTAK
jgi:hypothetical protein